MPSKGTIGTDPKGTIDTDPKGTIDTDPAGYAKPVPVPDERSRPFFEGALAGRLMLQRCEACGRWMWPVVARCLHCLDADVRWAPSRGEGTLYSFALVHQLYHPGFAEEIPYNVAEVDLAEGVRVLSTIEGVPADELRIGQPLVVAFRPVADGVVLPVFTPAAGTRPPPRSSHPTGPRISGMGARPDLGDTGDRGAGGAGGGAGG
jgi:uncharacterized OB-fold protein